MKRTVVLITGVFALTVSTAAIAAGNAEVGQSIFQSNCSECHWVDKVHGDSMGPNLDGFFGHPAASEENYCCYTTALKNAFLTWDGSTLDKWLTNPSALVPGTWMAGFPGLKSETARVNVIAYLSTLTGK